MGIARLTAICRKTKCGPLENVRTRLFVCVRRSQLGLELQNQLLKDGVMRWHIWRWVVLWRAGFGGELSAERNMPTSKQLSSAVLSSKCGDSGRVFRR
jgi:hypothetical protein